MFRFCTSGLFVLAFHPSGVDCILCICNHPEEKAIKKYGNPELLAELMPEVSPKRQHLKFWLLFGAITMVIFVIAGPQFGSKLKP